MKTDRPLIPPTMLTIPGYRPTKPPETFHDFRCRELAHLPYQDALVAWNGALRLAVRKLGAEPDLTRDKALRLLQELYGEAF